MSHSPPSCSSQSAIDDDLALERQEFQRRQFEIFNHDYREYAVGRSTDENLQSQFDRGFNEVAVRVRRYARLYGFLTELVSSNKTENGGIAVDYEKLRAERDKLHTLMEKLQKIGENSGNSTATVDPQPKSLAQPESLAPNLPEYSREDMELFLQEDLAVSSEQTDTRTHESLYHAHRDELMQQTQRELETMMKDCDKVVDTCCEVLHKLSICDRFLYE